MVESAEAPVRVDVVYDREDALKVTGGKEEISDEMWNMPAIVSLGKLLWDSRDFPEQRRFNWHWVPGLRKVGVGHQP